MDDTDDGLIETLQRNITKIPPGVSFIHVGRYVDPVQVFIMFIRANEETGTGYMMFHTSDNISIGNINLNDGEFSY